MSEEREEVYPILERGKHLKNLHHKKGFGGLLFIDLSMIKFSNLSSYIRYLDKENEELKEQLHDASIQIQELIEKDIWCPSNCEKLEKLQQENKQLKDNWNKLKEDLINDINYWREQEKEWIKLGFIKFGGEANTKIIFKKVLDKMQELEGSRE